MFSWRRGNNPSSCDKHTRGIAERRERNAPGAECHGGGERYSVVVTDSRGNRRLMFHRSRDRGKNKKKRRKMKIQYGVSGFRRAAARGTGTGCGQTTSKTHRFLVLSGFPRSTANEPVLFSILYTIVLRRSRGAEIFIYFTFLFCFSKRQSGSSAVWLLSRSGTTSILDIQDYLCFRCNLITKNIYIVINITILIFLYYIDIGVL